MRSTERDTGPTMISRVSEILRAFQGSDRVLGVSEIARRTGIPLREVVSLAEEAWRRRRPSPEPDPPEPA